MNITKLELKSEIELNSSVQLLNLSDLDMDVEAFLNWDSRWNSSNALWLVKESGTVLLPLGHCVNPVFVDCAYDVSCQAFLVETSTGTFTPIASDKARELIMVRPKLLQYAASTEEKVVAIRSLLERKYVTDWLLVKCQLSKDSSMSAWLSYFERIGHPLMVNILKEVS